MNRTALILTCLLVNPIFADLKIQITNPLAVERKSETIELSAAQLQPLSAGSLQTIHITDSAGKAVLCQAVDTDFDELRQPDVLIFQTDLAPSESKTFTAAVGEKHVYTVNDFKAYGRFNRERFDDFAWENDRIAHRTYGKALITWKGEPLTSNTIDIWSKRTTRMVLNEWYMADNYHADHGEGADFYSAGKSRGCGADGLWADGKLWVGQNFVESRVLTNGPIRVMFELDYEPFDVNGMKVSEVRRISLDAGSNLDQITCIYKIESGSGPLVAGLGMKKVSGQTVELNPKDGWLAQWEAVAKNNGMQAIGILADPNAVVDGAHDDLNNLLLVKVGQDNTVRYRAGFYWDKSGHFPNFDAWKAYLTHQQTLIGAPVRIEVSQ